MEKLVCNYQTNHLAITQPEGKITPCCHFISKSNEHWDDVNISNTNTLDKLHQTYRWYDLRHTLADGIKYSGCDNCWRAEQLGYISKRQYYNLINSGSKLEDLELAFDFNCNFMCRSCRPGISSTWNRIDVSELLHIDKDHYNPLQIKNYKNKLKDLLLHTNLHHLKRLSVVGGEPFLSSTFKWFLTTINRPLQIKITTNGSIFPDKEFLDLLNQHEIFIDVSIDAIGKLAEVIRYGTLWSTIDNNIKKFIEAGFAVKICTLISLMNINKLQEVVVYARSLNLPIVPQYLNQPDYLRSNILPYDIRKKWKLILPKKPIEIKFMDINKMHCDVSEFNSIILNESLSDNKLLDFIKSMHILDEHQQIKFSDVNPEIWKIIHEGKDEF